MSAAPGRPKQARAAARSAEAPLSAPGRSAALRPQRAAQRVNP